MTQPREPDAAVRERLAALRVDAPDDGFSLALHRKLVDAGAPEPVSVAERAREFLKRRAPILWPTVGALAGVTAFFVMSALHPVAVSPTSTPSTSPQPATVASANTEPLETPATVVPQSRVAVIKLDFTADVAVENADFQISLPEGLSFYADGEELPMRSFEWTQALAAGNNVIPVAVRGTKPGRYLVTAVARVGDQKIEHDVVLEVTSG